MDRSLAAGVPRPGLALACCGISATRVREKAAPGSRTQGLTSLPGQDDCGGVRGAAVGLLLHMGMRARSNTQSCF